MYLYHYSQKQRRTLLTLAQQGGVRDEDHDEVNRAARFRGDPGPYYDHISFFIEPAPLDIVGDIFPDDHPAWRQGNVVYEHQVKLEDIDIYGWMLVESALAGFVMDYLYYDNDTYKRFYFMMKKYATQIAGQRGVDNRSCQRAVARYKPGDTRRACEKLRQRADFDDMAYKYAPMVPHLMIYTRHPIKVAQSQKCVVGDVQPGLESRVLHRAPGMTNPS